MATEAELRKVLERFAESQAAGDRDAWLDLFTTDAIQFEPVGAPPREGRDGLIEGWNGLHAQATSIQLRFEDVIVCDHDVAAVATARCSDPKGRHFEVRSIDLFSFAPDGRIRELRAFWNLDRVFFPFMGLLPDDLS